MGWHFMPGASGGADDFWCNPFQDPWFFNDLEGIDQRNELSVDFQHHHPRPQLRIPHPYLQIQPLESHTLESILFQDSAHVKPCHMKSESGIIRIAAIPLCCHRQLWTTTLFGLQLILCVVVHLVPN